LSSIGHINWCIRYRHSVFSAPEIWTYLLQNSDNDGADNSRKREGVFFLPAIAWNAFNLAAVSVDRTNWYFFHFVFWTLLCGTSRYQTSCCPKGIDVGFVILRNQVFLIVGCSLLSREKNSPQVYLAVTDGFVNKCGNNSTGATVLAAGTPGHNICGSVEWINAVLYIFVSAITFSSLFLSCYENNLPQPITNGPWFLNSSCQRAVSFSSVTPWNRRSSELLKRLPL